MASEEQLNNQEKFNSSLNDAAEFIGLITSRTSDLVDAFRRLNNRSQQVNRDQSETLKILKSINTTARNLTAEYSSVKEVNNKIKEVTKDQIKLDNTLISLASKLSKEKIKGIEIYQNKQKEVNNLEKTYGDIVKELSTEQISQVEKLTLLKTEQKQAEISAAEALGVIDKDAYDIKKAREEELAAFKLAKQQELAAVIESGNKKAIAAARRAKKDADDLYSAYLDTYTLSEKEYDIANKTLESKNKELKIAEKEAGLGLVDVANSKVLLDNKKKELSISYLQLDIGQKQYLQALEARGETEKINQFLEEQLKKQKRIEKSQGLFNVTLGFAGGLLEGLGVKSAAVALGLEEGKKAAEEMAKAIERGDESTGLLGARVKVFGAGLIATIKGIIPELKLAAIVTALGKTFGGAISTIKGILQKGLSGVFNFLISPAKQVVSEIGGLFSEGIDYIKNSFFSVKGFMDSFKEGEALMKELSLATEKIATDLGVSTKEAKGLTNQVAKFSSEMGAFPEKLAENMVLLNKEFGTTQKFSDETARSYNRLIERAGFAADEAAQFVKLSQLQGKNVNDTLAGYEEEIMYLKAINNSAVSQKEVLQEVAKASSATRLTFRGQGKSLGEAAFQAKALGLEMSKLEDIGGSLLNFEDSIAKEMEAELLLGKDLNLERARQAALQGDSATLAKELAKNIGSAAEFGKKNVIQQEALAAAVGMTRDELAKTLETQELLAGTGLDDMNQAQEEYNKMLKETGDAEKAAAKFRQKYGNDALSQQVAQVAYAKQDELRQRQLVATQMEMAQAMLPVAKAFRQIVQYVQDLRKILIDKMQPFFKAFGKLVGEGGKSFKDMAEGPVGKLGEKLNDIGLKLVEFFKVHGPEIKKIFSQIFDVFGAIYSKVGEVIGELFSMGDANKTASGVLGGMSDILSGVVEYIKNIDAKKLAEDIKDFVGKIKGISDKVKETIDKVDAFIQKNPTLVKLLGGGALAITLSNKVAPELTKAVLGASGSLLKMAGGRAVDLGKTLGNNISSKLGFGKVFGMTKSEKENLGTSSSNPMYVEVTNASDIGGGDKGMMGDALNQVKGRKAGIGGGFRSGAKGLMSYAKDAFKGGRAGKVGRARLARAAKGLVTGKGPSFVGGAAKASKAASTAAQAGKAVSTATRVGKVASTGLKLAKGAAGGIGSLLGGLALDYAANKKKNEAAEKRALAAQATTEEERQKLLKEAGKAETTSKLASIGSSAATGAGIGATIGSVVPGVGTAIGGAVGGVIGGGIGVVKEYGDEIKKGLGDAFTSVSKKSSEVWSSVKTTGENVWGEITEKASGYWDTISGKATDSWNSVKIIGADTWNSITETANGAWEGIKGFGSGIWDSIKSGGESIWGGITSTADTAWEGIKEKGKEIWGSIKGKGKEIWGSIEGFAKGPIDKIKSTFSNIFNLDSGIIGKTKDIFKNLLPDSVVSIMTSLGILEEEKKPTPPPKSQKVKDGSTVSNKGPFTISDRFGNVAITHPKDNLVVSPNISYINDGMTGKGGPVFPVSEDFGALDVKVSPKGVMVQKISDASSVTKTDNKFVEKIKEAKEQIWNTYNQAPRSVVPGNPGIYAWDSNVEAMFTLKPEMKSSQQLMEAVPTDFIHKLRTTEPELVGLRSDMGFANPDEVKTPVIQNLVNEAFSWTTGGYQYRKGNESTLDSILDPYQPKLIRSLIKGYAPVSPSSTTTFHTLDKKEGYKPGIINVGQSASEGLSLENIPQIQKVQDGSSSKGPFTIMDRLGNIAVTHPKDGLVVSPNISYVNDGVTSKKGPVFPVSEDFGALDVKVSPKGVMVQKISDGISAKDIDKSKQEIWDKYKSENRRVIPGKPGVYAWDGNQEKMFFINPSANSPSQITFANSDDFYNYFRTANPELIGARSDMGFVNPKEINLNILKNLIYEALGASEGNPAGVGQKGNESTLDSILDPFQPEIVRQTIKGYVPLDPSKTTRFHTLDKKEGYRPPDLISISQSVSEGLSLENAAIPKLAEGGVVSKPTVALIGEAGPEAVVPLDQIAQESPQTSTTIVESDNSDLKKELQEMKQLMASLISQIPSIANRPITVELNGNKVGQALGQNAYRM